MACIVIKEFMAGEDIRKTQNVDEPDSMALIQLRGLTSGISKTFYSLNTFLINFQELIKLFKTYRRIDNNTLR